MSANLITDGIYLFHNPGNKMPAAIIEELRAQFGEPVFLYLFDFTAGGSLAEYGRKQEYKESVADIRIRVPQINKTICKHCGKCTRYCEGKALQKNKSTGKMMLIEEHCNDCGKCYLVCNVKGVLAPVMKTLGQWERLESGNTKIYRTVLRRVFHYRAGIAAETGVMLPGRIIVLVCDDERIERLLRRYSSRIFSGGW